MHWFVNSNVAISWTRFLFLLLYLETTSVGSFLSKSICRYSSPAAFVLITVLLSVCPHWMWTGQQHHNTQVISIYCIWAFCSHTSEFLFRYSIYCRWLLCSGVSPPPHNSAVGWIYSYPSLALVTSSPEEVDWSVVMVLSSCESLLFSHSVLSFLPCKGIMLNFGIWKSVVRRLCLVYDFTMGIWCCLVRDRILSIGRPLVWPGTARAVLIALFMLQCCCRQNGAVFFFYVGGIEAQKDQSAASWGIKSTFFSI